MIVNVSRDKKMKKILFVISFLVFCSHAFAAIGTDLKESVQEKALTTVKETAQTETKLKESAKELPVRCTGDNVTYVKEENTIYGKGNVEIGYKDNYIRADSVKVNIKTKEAEAEGRVIVSDGTNIFTGDKVYYNFGTGIGKVDGMTSRLGPWFAKGEQGERIPEKPYYIKNGYVTTCDYDKPHYRMKASDIYIYPGDKVVTKNIVFYLREVPVFYWPYYSKSLKDDRSPWTFVPGYNNKFGKYLLTGYTMWIENFLGGKFRPTLKLDYYEKRGIAGGLYGKYGYKDKIQALIRSYLINDKAYKSGKETIEKTRGRFSMDYAQKITTDIRGVAEINLLSDPDIIKEYFKDEFKNEIQTENYINFSKTTQWYQLSLMTKKRLNSFYTDLEKLPELTFNLLQLRVGKTNLLYVCNASVGYLAQKFARVTGGKDYSAARFDTLHQLSYPDKYFGWLNITPRIGTRQTYWNKRAKWETDTSSTTQTKPTPPGAKTGVTVTTAITSTPTSTTTTKTTTTVDPVTTTIAKNITTKSMSEWAKGTWRSVYFTGAEVTTKISRVFDFKNEYWDIDQLRHVIEPRVNYVYQTEPTVLSENLLGFGDLVEKNDYFAYGLRNKLQTRRNKTAWNLIDFDVTMNYYPEQYLVSEITGERRNFSHIISTLQLRPFDWILWDMDADWDQYTKQLETYNTEMVFYKDDKISFGVGYRYGRTIDKLWTSEINYTINSNWALRMQHRFEFDTGELQEQEYILVRDMHCWNVAFAFRNYRDIDETACFVVLYPKAYPNIPVTFGTTYFGTDDTNKIDFGAM